MWQSFKLALRSIWDNKTRAFLTMLGIIIGVASVIILVSIVNGYMKSVTDSFTSMGVNQISVNVTNMASRSLSPEDFYEFAEENSDVIEYVTPTVSINSRIRNGDSTMSTRVTGYAEDMLKINEYEMFSGRPLSYADCKGNKRVCILGYYTAVTMFGTADAAVGQKVRIGNTVFTTVGVVERQDNENFEDGGSDDFCWVPYTAAAKMNRSGSVSSYTLTIRDVNDADMVTTQIENYLYTIFKDEDSYTVTANSAILDSMNDMITKIEALLGGIAGISLLVAGVGVMNIMLVSVTERTREIGIRKALGARKSTIMTQFVIEALVTSAFGGILGVAMGCGLTGFIGKIVDIESTPTFGAILISFSVSVAIGLIFGYMPANRAAKLNPIDALRSE